MLRFTFRRLLQIIPVLWIIITATFFMIRFVPGGPFTAEKAVTPEILRNLEAKGYVSHTVSGRAHRYRARVAQRLQRRDDLPHHRHVTALALDHNVAPAEGQRRVAGARHDRQPRRHAERLRLRLAALRPGRGRY